VTGWLQSVIDRIAAAFPNGSWMNYSYNIRALIAVILVSTLCGAVGSLVVGNRMAFFSDALAHVAFAGVTLGFILALATGGGKDSALIPIVMVFVGVTVGIAIAFVRERTGLANDTVIGVFFAAAVGLGGMLFGALQTRAFDPEAFLFGNVFAVYESELITLFVLALVVVLILSRSYNQFVLASFNPSLARSRQVSLIVCNYLFIIMLALIVNLCLRIVGALLINAMLVVPAAAAANFGRNLRQMFWGSVILSLVAGVSGLWISNTASWNIGRGQTLEFAPSGTIVVITVTVFFASVVWKAWRDRPSRAIPALAVVKAGAENGGGEPGLPWPT
jgi:zinc transport system permease protein